MNTLLLASSSPRRAQLLAQIGYTFQQIPTEIDESLKEGEVVKEYVLRMATEKASMALRTYGSQFNIKRGFILAADTIIALDDEIFGKPENQEAYNAMMSKLSNNTHHVYSAISLLKIEDNQLVARTERLNHNRVVLAPLPSSFIKYYWESGEPKDKAGGYAIQGEMASYIERIEGSYSGIMGLPLYELREALEQLGYNHS